MNVAKSQAGKAVEAVIRRAADRTGVDFGFLLKTAKRESSLNPDAKARSSSAAGLFQFVEQTWLGQLKRHGAKHGYGAFAAMIEQGRDGRLRCANDEARRAVMDLRFDPSCASLMAGELASDHQAYLKGRVGREPTSGELYAAHFLGPAGAAKLIEAQGRNPDARAADLFPQAASSNRSIFFPKGRAASVGELYAGLTRTPTAAAEAAPARASTRKAVEAAEPAVGKAQTYRVLGNESARAAYALETELNQVRQEQALVRRVLNGSPDPAAATGLFNAELLSVLAGADRDPAG
jgi:hypothetical protein